jgi:glycosyltransferase involved in cell wall biosynthesis
VVGTTAGGTGAHVRMLAAGLAGRGIVVSVLGPSSAEAAFGFGAIDGVTFSPAEFRDRPRARDVAAVRRLRRLRRLLSSQAGQVGSQAGQVGPQAGQTDRRAQSDRTAPTDRTAQSARAGVVHAHGLRAGALTVLALTGMSGRSRPGGRPALVVTVHNAPPSGRGAAALTYRVLERVVARRADLVLCVSADVEARMRSAGARRTGRAVVPAAAETVPADDHAPPPGSLFTPESAPTSTTTSARGTASAPGTASATGTPAAAPGFADASAAGRPVVLAVGRLAAQKGFDVLLAAAAHWQDLDPVPLLAIAGDGPLAGELRTRAAALGVDAAMLGHRDDVGRLLAAAAVFVLPSRWEGQPLTLQEALRAGAVIVATRVGGIPDLVGDDAALLVPPDDATALAAAVRAVLGDAPLAGRLRAAAARRGAGLPTFDDAVAAALSAYAQALE